MARLVLEVHLLPARLDRPMRGGRGLRMNEARGPPAGEHRPTGCEAYARGCHPAIAPRTLAFQANECAETRHHAA
ncbi:hypothetical protein K523DRAFT_150674 [Schizophyllum commune Tattone D]|nr:hypothetical protein K523DRAFT_150674 [Schizophyllum commune Tattone D]